MKPMMFFIFVFCTIICNGQRQDNIWCFGDSSGLNFNSGNPIPLNSVLSSQQTSSTLSDSNGNLLFYVGGKKISSNFSDYYLTIWNRQNQIMPHGDTIDGAYFVTQGSIIIPYPYDTSRYYLFSLKLAFGFNYNLYYSNINVNLDGGLGDVEQKNILVLNDTLSDKMQAVRHGNGRDWWLLVHKYAANVFYEYLIDSNGIHGPFISSLGSIMGASGGGYGQMIFSPTGDKILCLDASGVIDLFDFDRCTGVISNWNELGTSPYNVNGNAGPYGCSFSPNGKVIYVSNVSYPDSLFQFDLTVGNIKASRQTIWENTNPLLEFGQHKLASDGKIYVTISHYPFPNNYHDSTNMNLCVINSPDFLGSSCNFVPFSVYLGGRRCFLGLPNDPNYSLGAFTGSPCDTLTVGGINEVMNSDLEISIYPIPNNGLFTLSFSSNKNPKDVFIYDVLGNIIYQQLKVKDSSLNIDLRTQSKGIYFVKVIEDIYVLLKKVILN